MKVIIITSQRSGSNFLRHSLNSHPKVTCDGELLIGGMIPLPRILENWRLPAKLYRYIVAGAWNPVSILEKFLARNDSPIVGFKAMYNHLANSKVRKFLQHHTEIRIIHLRRDNLLKQYVSKALLGVRRSKRWEPHSTKKLPIVSTRISPDAAIKAMQQTQKQFEEYEKLLVNHHKIELVYENMINGRCLSDHATKEICKLLDVEDRPLCCDFVKVNPNELKLMIDNYEEIVSALHGTPFKRFLD
jgi:LPS sulfotransferase NodH